MRVNLLQPNKTDVVPFLDSGAKAPARYARATVVSGTEELYWQEYMVGPLPATNMTDIQPLTYPFTNSQPGKTVVNPVYSATDGAQFQEKFGLEVEDITKELFNTVSNSKACYDAWQN
jgi:primary-amine oxidase